MVSSRPWVALWNMRETGRISKREIEDKSKGDIISKAVVVFQTGWFVAQCITRASQGLPITELELITVAFAAFNLTIYLLWWDKPQNVQCGVRVYKKRSTEGSINDEDVEATVGFRDALRDALSVLPSAIVHGPLPEYSRPWVVRVLAWPILKPLEIIIGGDYTTYVKRVNTFYPGNWYIAGFAQAIVVTAIVSAFGGIHCIGWLFYSPSSTEQTLWRVALVSIVGDPIVVSLVSLAVEISLDRYEVGLWKMIIIPLLPLYILGRLVLLALPFLYLKSLPPAAYHIVTWTSFIPHV